MLGQDEEIVGIVNLVCPQLIDIDKSLNHRTIKIIERSPSLTDVDESNENSVNPNQQDADIKDIYQPELKSVPYSIKKFVDNQSFLSKFWSFTCLAIIFLPLLGIILSDHITLNDAKEIWSTVLTPVIALVGSVFGYYFSKGQNDK